MTEKFIWDNASDLAVVNLNFKLYKAEEALEQIKMKLSTTAYIHSPPVKTECLYDYYTALYR